MVDRAFEHAVVVRSCCRGHMIPWRFGREGLHQFLQFPLGILESWNDRDVVHRNQELIENKLARGLEAAIQENRPKHGFKGISQGRLPVSSPGDFLAAADNEMAAQAQLTCAVGETS